MKLIITGARGFVGGEVLRQSLKDDKITSIVALLRKRLPQDHPKVTQMLMEDEDWLSYPEAVTRELQGAEGCVWYVYVWLFCLVVPALHSTVHTVFGSGDAYNSSQTRHAGSFCLYIAGSGNDALLY